MMVELVERMTTADGFRHAAYGSNGMNVGVVEGTADI